MFLTLVSSFVLLEKLVFCLCDVVQSDEDVGRFNQILNAGSTLLPLGILPAFSSC